MAIKAGLKDPKTQRVILATLAGWFLDPKLQEKASELVQRLGPEHWFVKRLRTSGVGGLKGLVEFLEIKNPVAAVTIEKVIDGLDFAAGSARIPQQRQSSQQVQSVEPQVQQDFPANWKALYLEGKWP